MAGEDPQMTFNGAARNGPRPSLPVERAFIRRLLRFFGSPAIAVRLWDGVTIMGDGKPPLATIVVHDPRVLRQMLLHQDVGIGDQYAAGAVDVEGDFAALLSEVFTATARGAHRRGWIGLLTRLLKRRPRRNTLAGSKQNIHHHYDIGNDFYKLWLDREMQYTCAYYPAPGLSLEEAQRAKMDHVCRKLQLQEGDTVVEAGCGWGGLALHMAGHYGARVRAYNISYQQVKYATARARDEGLSDRLEYVEDDYRNVSGEFDVFVSVGMLEHVGVAQYPDLGNVIARSLRRGGRGLIHTIGRNRPQLMNSWIEKRIFPGAYPPTLGEMMPIFEKHNLSILDVENMRLHYARTLEDWRDNYEQSMDKVCEMFDRDFARVWHLYLCGSIAAFRVGSLQLFQVVFAHGDDNELPWNREHLYR